MSIPRGFEYLESKLRSNERPLWRGRPAQGLRLAPADGFFIPFSLLWSGMVFAMLSLSLRGGTSLLFLSPLLLFAALAVYLLIGRLFVAAWQRSRTFYLVSDQRLFILEGSTLDIMPLHPTPPIQVRRRPNGAGSVLVGKASPFAHLIHGSGMPTWGMELGMGRILHMLPSVDEVEPLLTDARPSPDTQGAARL